MSGAATDHLWGDDWEDDIGDDEVIPGPEDDAGADNGPKPVVQPASYPPVGESDRKSR
jgi:hypothetical protein